jgi:hypothetical protein
MEERRGSCRVLVGKTVGKRSFGRSRRKRQDNNKMDVQKVRLEHGLDFSGSE